MNPNPSGGQPLFLEAIALMRQGQFDAAEATFRRVLKREPHNPDACHLAGYAAIQAGRFKDAVPLLRRAVALNPRSPFYQFDLGTALAKLDHHDEALVNLDRAVALDPNYAEAHYHRGLALVKLKRLDEAVAAYERAISLQPDFADAHNDLGYTLGALRKHGLALESFQKALSLNPEVPAFLKNNVRALFNAKRHAEALSLNKQVLEKAPEDSAALVMQAEIMIQLGRHQEALGITEGVLAREPDNIGAYVIRTIAFLRSGQNQNALIAAEQAKAIAPDDFAVQYNFAYALAQFNRHKEALAHYEAALRITPDDTNAGWARALTQLTLGHFAEGWSNYEIRNRMPDVFGKRPYTEPLWLGQQTLQGKRLYVYWEQGFGDTIQFARYALLAAAAGAEVVLAVQDPLLRLFGDWFHGIRVIGHNQAPDNFHLHCPLLSMPLAFGTRLETIPSLPDGYLKASPTDIAVWQQKLPQKRRRIGVVWGGNPDHPNDHNRSLPLARLQGLWRPDDAWISLQKDVREADRPLLEAFDIMDPSAELKDFADTAALISALDLVISVDTSVAHLAGALGKPCWVMLPFVPDFRWLLDREDSPWYPKMRLFRQQRPGDWEGVVEKLGAALHQSAGR